MGIRGPEFNLTPFNVERIVEQWRAQPRLSEDRAMGTPVKLRARGVAASVVEHVPTPWRPAAGDSSSGGSGLKPVMGDPGMPVVGHTLEFLHDGLRHARRYHERFGTVFWLNAVRRELGAGARPRAGSKPC